MMLSTRWGHRCTGRGQKGIRTLIMLMWSGVQGNSSLQAELSSSSASFPDASPFAIPADTRSFASATWEASANGPVSSLVL